MGGITGTFSTRGVGSALPAWRRDGTAMFAMPDDSTSEQHRLGILLVALVSGFCGLFLGAQSGLQIPVESAQVLAGLVDYPFDNPFRMYHVKTWTLLHQIPALLLACGLDERIVSMLLGGLLGVMSFTGLSFCVLAFGRNWLLATLVPLLCLWTEAYQEIRGVYDVFLLSDRPWMYYGAFGPALVLLAWSLYGLGVRRTSALLMGFAPACHPALGAWCLGIGVMAFFWQRKQERPFVKPVVLWLGIGLLLSALSFGYHLHQINDLPVIPPDLRDKYVSAFAAGWDLHRQAYPLDSVGMYYGVCAAVIGLVGLQWLWRDAVSHEAFMFMIVALTVCAALSVLLAVGTQWREHLPPQLVMAMPGRYINVIAQAFPALVIGLAARYRWHPTICALQGGLMAYLALRVFRNETGIYVPEVHHVLLMSALTIMGCAAEVTRPSAVVLRILRPIAAATLLCLALWPAPRDWHGSLTYLLGVVAIYLPLVVRRLFDRDSFRSLILLVTVAVGASAAIQVLGWQPTVGIVLAIGAAWLLYWRMRDGRGWRLARAFRLAAAGGCCCLAALTLGTVTLASLAKGYESMRVWQSDPFLAQVHQGEGLIVIAPGVRGMQLRTRRPVLLGPLNQLPYVPESAPAMNAIVRRLYHDDLLEPRPADHVPEPGGIARLASQQLWQARSPATWRALADELGFTQVVVRTDWELQLPIVARSNYWVLYDVPDAEPPAEPGQRTLAHREDGVPGGRR
jgi:hypothetical protein